MPILTPPVQYNRKQWGYMAWHKGWRNTLPGVTGTQLVYKRIGIDQSESGLNSGNYRPASENTATAEVRDVSGRPYTLKAGADLGGEMWSATFSRIKDWHDPFQVFHPLWALSASLAQAFAEPTRPFARWGYGTTNPLKTDESIKLAEVIAECGPESAFSDISNSPFWLMMRNGVDPQDLPVPPEDVYFSDLPPAPLRMGTASPNNTALQRWLSINHWYSATPVAYYGNNTALGVSKVQMFVRDLGLWTGPVDGREWSVALRELIDDLQKWDFLTLWS